jgi:two-component system, chemotaxis family, protein-glutamate methylesterase/glutaminase
MGKIEAFVVGGSSGALEPLQKIAAGLPRDFPAAICVVLHLAPDSPGLLPSILSKAGPLPACHPKDGEAIEPGRIYVAPPDYHLAVSKERTLRLGRGPKENRFRPAIDTLFRSAALYLRERACGVILSGALDDGAAGLAAIKDKGGAAIVQDPADALVRSMPQAALRAARDVDRRAPASKIASVMLELATQYSPAAKEPVMSDDDLEKENTFALGIDSGVDSIRTLGKPSLFTCPDCHGAMMRLRDPDRPRFRCHTGHAYSLESLAAAQQEHVEDSLWNAIRALEEQASLLEHFAEHFNSDDGQRKSALHEAEEAQWRSRLVRDAVRSDR